MPLVPQPSQIFLPAQMVLAICRSMQSGAPMKQPLARNSALDFAGFFG